MAGAREPRDAASTGRWHGPVPQMTPRGGDNRHGRPA
jgi:hypothetical protein